MAKMVVLKSSDGETFEVEEAVALESQTLKYMIEDDCADATIPVANITGKILAMVIEYCKGRQVNSSEEELKKFDANFMKVDTDILYHLIMAANFLNINSLLDLTCQTAANMMKGKTPEEIRKMLNIKNDFSPEEEEEVRKENAWAYE